MVLKESSQRVTAIVPAYNEEERLSSVLEVLTTYPGFCEVIVVNDGSQDNTAEVTKRFPVRLIQNPTNLGKAYAMDIAVKQSQGDVVFFCDADIKGLSHRVIQDIVEPVLRQEVDMFIGMRNRKIYFLSFILAFVPLLGGERALTKELWQKLPDYYKTRFRVETGLNFYAAYYGKGFSYKVFKGLTQTIKEKKYGLWTGLRQRIGMYYDIFSAQWHLQFHDIPATVKNKRLAVAGTAWSMNGILLGAAMIVAASYGPKQFVQDIFRERLENDPSTPIINFLLYLASITSVNIILVLGFFILSTNFITFLLDTRRLLKLQK